MKKRVLQLIGSFHQGGSERQAVGLTRLLINDGRYDVLAATLNNSGPLRPEIGSVGLAEIPEFPLTSFYDANFVRQVRRCAAYLRDQKIDLVHTHDFYTNVFGMAAASLARIRGRVASKRETGGMRSRAQEFVERVAFSRADRIIVNSSAVRGHLLSRGVRGQTISVIYNGIDLKRFGGADDSGVRNNLGLPTNDDVRLITMVANLRHDVKNVPMLLRAACDVIVHRPKVHFVVAGEGELEQPLKQTAAELNIASNVHLVGRCTDVPALLAASNVCVLTSTAEGFSNSILEYMAAGRPVVATDVGGAAEAIVDGKTGYLVPSDDDGAMAERLMELLKDEGQAEQMGAAGRERTREMFSEKAQLEKTIDLYESVLNG